ncbi:unnamed protein product [Paramecium octaurelia]|uniref:Uncharacterized protein n=1 Tax=Paramecium octaurelia TaxID=43137 RepID=A0A8S1VXC8_PAROT|nr:unnamed protein product [Paramecium octaurelia]CAD8182569.1 unnamed protein product [Paramecium octaurelia]
MTMMRLRIKYIDFQLSLRVSLENKEFQISMQIIDNQHDQKNHYTLNKYLILTYSIISLNYFIDYQWLKQNKLHAIEEKRIVQQVGALERSLPYIEPLEKEIKILRNLIICYWKKFNNEINHYKQNYEQLKNSAQIQLSIKQINQLIMKVRIEGKVQELKDRKKDQKEITIWFWTNMRGVKIFRDSENGSKYKSIGDAKKKKKEKRGSMSTNRRIRSCREGRS